MTDLTTSPAPVGTLVRLSVSAADRQADLGIPGNVPVAEIVPGLARTLGLLDAATVYGGYQLMRSDGSVLDTARSLVAQGVEDGAALILESGARRVELRVYDDVVEAVADAVEGQYAPWTTHDSTLSAAWGAVALLLTGAVLLLGGDRSSIVPPVVATIAAVLVLACGAVVGRVGREPATGRVLVMSAPVLGAVAGLTSSSQAPSWGWPAALAGVGALLTGLLAIPALVDRRELCAAPALAGLALAVTGATVALTGSEPGAVLAVVVAIVVTASIGIPWLALSSTPLRIVSARTDADLLVEPPVIDPLAVRSQHARGHRLQLALRAAVGLLVFAATPAIVAGRPVGTLLLVLAYAGLLLGIRQSFSRHDVLLVVAVGVVGLAGTGIAAALLHPEWRDQLVVGIAVAAAATIGLGLVSPRTRVGLARLADSMELACLALLLPLGIAAAGIV